MTDYLEPGATFNGNSSSKYSFVDRTNTPSTAWRMTVNQNNALFFGFFNKTVKRGLLSAVKADYTPSLIHCCVENDNHDSGFE